MTPPRVSLEFHMRRDLDGDCRDVLSHWRVDVVNDVEDASAPYGVREVPVGHVDIVDVTIGHPDTYAALDSLSTDLTRIADALIDQRSGELLEEVEERLEMLGSRLLVLNEVRLDRQWRGRGLGVLVAGEALTALSPGAQLAATIPGSLPDLPGSGEVPRRSVAEESLITAKLGAVWAQIGFEPVSHGVWIVDLAMGHLYDGLNAIRVAHGLEPSPSP